MEAIIYGKLISNSVGTLASLIETFKEYTNLQELPQDDELQYEETLQAIDLIKGSISQINSAKNELQSSIDKMKNDYDTVKNKEDKKNILQELQKIEQEVQFTTVLKEATELSIMLNTRLTEAHSNERRLARKLGKCFNSQSFQEDNQMQSVKPENTVTTHILPQANQLSGMIPPPKINLPKFYGNEQEFPEFWAAYETLVHNNRALTATEKMLLLKESPRGKSNRAIKGIQLLPQNYPWMVETLAKKYGNKPANRSRIVQQLQELSSADRRAESNELVYDKICVLLNQMLSAGQDIRATKDAMWTETILSKFHKDIVEPVLVKMREKDDATVDSIMQMIETQITAKSYIQSRTKLTEPKKRLSHFQGSRPQKCPICEKDNHFAWQCTSPLTVAEKRRIMLDKRLCWKCYSDQHSSKDCTRQNCPLCGKLHHKKLCFASETANHFHMREISANIGSQSNSLRQTLREHYQQPQEQRNCNHKKFERASESHTQRPLLRRNQTTSFHIEGNQNKGEPKKHEPTSKEIQTTVNHTTIRGTSSTQGSHQIILMTAEGNIWNHNTEKFEKAVFLFDTGAQKTIIEEEFAFELRLPSERLHLKNA